MPTSQTPRPVAAHPRTRSLRIAWRIQGVVEWLAQKATPQSWWNSRTVPGTIVVATNSALARGLIDEFLTARPKGGLFGIKAFNRLMYARDLNEAELAQSLDVDEAEGETSLVCGAWRIDVNRGTEQALLRDLEYFVARELEKRGGYAGIDPRLSVAIARRTIAAHQARRVMLTRSRYRAIPSAPVRFAPAHETYVSMITRDPARAPRVQARKVTVAILDSAFNPRHLAPGVNVDVRNGVLSPDQMKRPHLGHGAVTASIIGSLAPTATIVVYPVVGGDEIPLEDDVALSLRNAVHLTHAEVVVMCLQMPEHNGRSVRGLVELSLDGVGERPVVVASSGNRETAGSLVACYPGTHRAVMMVGGVDSSGARADFSCYDLRGRPQPALFVVAPGGAGPTAAPREHSISVGGQRIVGTSVAAAYAAGVVARSLARSDEPPGRAADLYRLLADAAVKADGWDDEQYGKGLVHELTARSAPVSAGAPRAPTPTVAVPQPVDAGAAAVDAYTYEREVLEIVVSVLPPDAQLVAAGASLSGVGAFIVLPEGARIGIDVRAGRRFDLWSVANGMSAALTYARPELAGLIVILRAAPDDRQAEQLRTLTAMLHAPVDVVAWEGGGTDEVIRDAVVKMITRVR